MAFIPRLLFVSLTLSFALSCGDTQPAVNRVQPYALEKAIFEGTWYSMQTVTKVPHTIAYTFVGDQSRAEKITWEIQEELLIARRSYQWIQDGEGAGPAGISGTGEAGAAIAIYRIETHFDIQRSYNEVTGEELNVIVENDEDRPWYEREYMRVDWSANLVTEPDFLLIARVDDAIETEPVAYYVEDPNHPDAPRFERSEASESIDYIDVVNKVFVMPQMVDYDDGYGPFPACWVLYQNHVDCASAELTVRNSFLKVDDARDYEPWDYPGDRLERFGYFYTDRAGYDPDYGVVEPARSHFINRHGIWAQSYQRDEEGGFVACSNDGECGGGGAICDDQLARTGRVETRVCTIPFRQREVRPVTYYLSERFPEDLIPDAERVVDEWNDVFVETVKSMRENECLTDGGSDCASERARDDVVFTLCHNPTTEEDHTACGEPGTIARVGDLRYSLLAWVHEPHFGVPLGFGPAAADPETGELIQASAFNYGSGIEELAAYAADLVALLNGDLAPDDVISGENVERFVDTMRGRDRSRERTADRHVIPYDGADARDIDRAMGIREMIHSRPRRRPTAMPRSRGEMAERMRSVKRSLTRGELPLAHEDGRLEARLRALHDSPIEALMTGPQMRFAAGVEPTGPLSDGVLEAASPLRGMSPARMRALQRTQRRLSSSTGCLLRGTDFGDDGLIGLARAVQRAVESGGTFEWYGVEYDLRAEGGGVDYDAVKDMLRHPIFTTTAAHEIGHTLGLRHNFAASYDSLNYNARYWQLRDDGNMRPRAYDPMTDAEIDGRIREYQYSSAMDYGNNFVSTDAFGLGHYDAAAIKMGYGDLVEVFTDATDPAELAWVNFMSFYGYPVALKSSSFFTGDVEAWTYTEIPAMAGGIAGLEQRADVPWESLVPEPTLAADGIDDPLVDPMGRPVVPYRYCSDEIVDLWPECMVYDAGADQYETLQSVIDTYWNYYLFTNFRRERLGFDVDHAYDSVYWRWFSKLIYANQDYVFNRAFMEEIFFGEPSFDDFFEREDGMGAYTVGVGSAFSLFTQVIATPEPGPYVEYDTGDGTTAYYLDEYFEPEAEVPFFDGRYLETSWNFDEGYYWFDQLERAGYFYDKILALESLMDAQAFFVGEDEASDTRGFAISFHTTFPEATSAALAGVLAEDWARISPTIEGDGSLSYPTPDEITTGVDRGVPVDPRTGFSVQLYAAIYAMAFIPLSYDHTFMEQARIYVDGGAEGITIPPGEQVEFINPFTSVRYLASSYLDEFGEETGLGAQMLIHAQSLVDNDAFFELDLFMDVINLQRTLTWEYGFGI